MDILNQLLTDPKYHDILAILKGTRNGIVYGAKLRFSHALVMSFLFRSGSIQSRWAGIVKATRQHATALGTFVFIYKSMLYLLKLARVGLLDLGAKGGAHGAAGAGAHGAHHHKMTTAKHDIQTHAHGVDAFVAGLVAGYIVFGRASPTAGLNSINQQMVLYVFSRVVLALCKMALDHILTTTVPLSSLPAAAAAAAAANSEGKFQIGAPIDQAMLLRRGSPQATLISNTAWTVFATLSWGIIMYLFRVDSSLLQHSMLHSMKFLYVDSETWSSWRDFF